MVYKTRDKEDTVSRWMRQLNKRHKKAQLIEAKKTKEATLEILDVIKQVAPSKKEK